jgi:hypothetical protein
MTTFKMPEPIAHGWVGGDGHIRDCISPETYQVIEGQYNLPMYTAQALRDILEQAALECMQHGMADYPAMFADRIRAMKEQIK